ncbi:DUF6221 family protein [Streptosporangium vulgare]|uniref:DUF6221 family protein n=1 Tax=Streptosporangium vulgare TaxID=46190 RepID=A0ABV5TQ27_9ACTN
MTTEHPIAVFLRARQDEAAAEAQETLDRNAAARARRMGSTLWDEEDARARQDLRDIESKRRILNDVLPEIEYMESVIEGEWGRCIPVADRLLKVLARPASDHDDFDPAWSTE